MSEAIFPLFGPVLVFVGILPLSALLAKALLFIGERLTQHRTQPVLRDFRYFVVVMSSLAPLVWLISASLHQSESGHSVAACAMGHASTEVFCPETSFFALALFACCVLFGRPRIAGVTRNLEANELRHSYATSERLRLLIAARKQLADLTGRCFVDNSLSVPIATMGALKPRVVLRTSFADQLDDEALAGALHHELAHVRGRDPLRYRMAGWSLAVNPWGRFFLEREISQWRLERELDCDRQAVLNGANAPAVAHALIIAATPVEPRPVPALGNMDGRLLKLRVSLLLAYAERAPVRSGKDPALLATAFATICLALLPHGGATGALDVVHRVAETAIMFVTN